jgi:ketosteroid isomerase-like protein
MARRRCGDGGFFRGDEKLLTVVQGRVVLETIRGGEVVHWRDYLDPVAVFDALGWPPR